MFEGAGFVNWRPVFAKGIPVIENDNPTIQGRFPDVNHDLAVSTKGPANFKKRETSFYHSLRFWNVAIPYPVSLADFIVGGRAAGLGA